MKKRLTALFLTGLLLAGQCQFAFAEELILDSEAVASDVGSEKVPEDISEDAAAVSDEAAIGEESWGDPEDAVFLEEAEEFPAEEMTGYEEEDLVIEEEYPEEISVELLQPEEESDENPGADENLLLFAEEDIEEAETGEEIIQESLAGDSLATATTIGFGSSYYGTISATNTTDYYRFTLPSSGRITLNASAYMRYIYYYLYDSSANQMWSANPYWNSTSEVSSTSMTMDLTQGTYYFRAFKDGSNYGGYNFNISFTSAGETFAESGTGTDNSMWTAHSISFGRTYRGQIAQNDDKDFYKLTLGTSGKIALNATAQMRYIYYYLYDADGKQLLSRNPYWNGTAGQSVVSYEFYLTSGTYYLACTKDGGNTGNYFFNVTFSSAGETFKETGYGSDNSLATARSISLNTLYKGQLALNDDRDFYKFSLSGSTTVTLDATATGMKYVYYYIYDSSGSQIWSKNPYWNSTTGTTDSTFDIVLSKGTYYFAVVKDGSDGNYSFKFTKLNLNMPKLLATYNGAYGIGIKWQVESNADSYEIWRKYKGNWSRIATVGANDASLQRSGNTLMYTDKAVKNSYGEGYIYSVAAVRGSVVTAYNTAGLAAYRLAPPSFKSGTNSAKSKATLYWNSTPCHGYQVQYCISTNTSRWTVLSTTSRLSGTVGGLTRGKRYYFRIRCYKTNADRGTTWSEYSPWFGVTISK